MSGELPAADGSRERVGGGGGGGGHAASIVAWRVGIHSSRGLAMLLWSLERESAASIEYCMIITGTFRRGQNKKGRGKKNQLVLLGKHWWWTGGLVCVGEFWPLHCTGNHRHPYPHAVS